MYYFIYIIYENTHTHTHTANWLLLYYTIVVTLYFKVQFSLIINLTYDICLNKLLIYCLLIVRKVVVKFRYWVRPGM